MITLANRTQTKAKGIGSACPLPSLPLTYVLYVPDSPFNLISISKLIHEFCTEMVRFRKKKDKISLDSKLLIKLMRDVDNSNSGNLFVQKPQTRTTVFKGFQMSPLPTAAFELFQMTSLSTAAFELSGFQMPPLTTTTFELSGFQMPSLSTAAIDTLKPGFTYCDMFAGVCSEDPV